MAQQGSFPKVPAVCLLISLILFTVVDCVDLTVQGPEERECYGTSVGFGYSGTLELHYLRLVKRYTGCTYIHGNLEITLLEDPNVSYDLSFLSTIRYISGYLLIALITEVDTIPLDSLEVIRGNKTYSLMGEEYSLVVVLTAKKPETPGSNDGLKELHMPRLKEITNGKVLFTENPHLGYINTVDWEGIMRGRLDDVHYLGDPFDETVADFNDTSICPFGMRWGDHPSLCQEVVDYIDCDVECSGRCFGPGRDQCCHDTCAVGCNGPSDEECFICKDYIYESHCVGFCPARTYQRTQNCIKY